MSVTPEVAKPSITRSCARIIKLGISLVYFVLKRIRRLAGGKRAKECVVLYYHSVPGRYRERFREQMRQVRERSMAIDLGCIDELDAGSKSVAITFDDALENVSEQAVPVLVEMKIPATVFVVADALGRLPKWGEGYYGPEEKIMSAEQLQRLPELITIGSHTLTHPNLTEIGREAVAKELKESREKLEGMVRRRVALFSFPHGEYNEGIVEQCREAGYERAFSTEAECLSGTKGTYVLGRVAADPWDWRIEYALKIAGGYCWQPFVRRVSRRIRG